MADNEIPLETRIAASAKASAAEVREVFESYGIPLAHPPARPRPLRIHRLRIAGDRTGALSPGPFDSTLSFRNGLTALVAANLRGKSSVLELITWCLRGEPRELPGPVRKWLREVDLDATVAGQAMGFRLNLENKEITSAVVLAAPSLDALARARVADGAHGIVPLLGAGSSQSYAAQVQALMMDWMDLHPLVSAFKETSTTTHGWPAYFGAVYLPPGRSKALIGDVVMSGLPGRLLQVFLDLPAAGALTKVKTEHTLLAARRKKSLAAAKALRDERAAERSRVQADLTQARAHLASLSPAEAAEHSSLTELAGEAVRLARAVADTQDHWDDYLQAHRRARAQRQRDEKRLNDVSESATARLLFHGLDPKACPRCDKEIAADRRQQERDAHACAVCARPVEGDDETPQEVLDEARQCLESSAADERAAKESLEAAETALSRLTSELETAQDRLRRAESAAQVPARAQAQEEVLRLEGALSVFPELPPVVEDPADVARLKILGSAVKVLEDAHTTASDSLFKDINQHIVDLGLQFGITSLESVEIDRAAHLDVTTSGDTQSFGTQSPGERLRLRIAVVIALLRVGAVHQVSTHPGLLLIDSPKAEEIQDVDIRSLVKELAQVAQANDLQVLITTTDRAVAHDVLSDENIIESRDSEPLW
ncbi:hypothetical protein [Streptomyces sp. NBC_00118]|uniref:hypothetical protein n=1 Tax=Streptomyces sp. NBC_00118 TaxID=2975658 RepID=UPI00324316F8